MDACALRRGIRNDAPTSMTQVAGASVPGLRQHHALRAGLAGETTSGPSSGSTRTSGVLNIMESAGIRLVGVNTENGQKLLYSIVFFVAIMLLQRGLRRGFQHIYLRNPSDRLRFWMIQGVNIGTLLVLVLGFLSIWFDDPTRLATGIGLVTAGVAFALQQVITAIAGYIVILRGEMFTVGDRITLGGVRGDVIGIRLTQTTIMEMGQPPAVQNADPAMWVRSRQYTGRIVNVSNAQVFSEPVYNYSRDFPFIWEEMSLPIPFNVDRDRVEQIMLTATQARTAEFIEDAGASIRHLARRHAIQPQSVEPRVYYRLTDNWLELTVRFIAPVRGVRDLKDELSRDMLTELDKAGIGLASATFDIVGLPPVRLISDSAANRNVHAD